MPITHATVATGTDSGTGEIHKAQWNADHVGGAALLGIASIVNATSYTTTSATPADTNSSVAVTFTAPASGNVLVRIGCAVNIENQNQNAFLGLRESTTDLGATKYFVLQGQTAMNQESLVSLAVYLTGVSAGSHTYKLSFCVNGGASFTVRSLTNFPVVLEVWSD